MKSTPSIFFIFIFIFAESSFGQIFNSISNQAGKSSVKNISLVQDEINEDQEIIAEPEPTLAANIVAFSLPVDHVKITSFYGKRIDPISKKEMFHFGIDLKTDFSAVYSVLDGVVKEAGYGRYIGNYVKIAHGDYFTIYGHLSKVYVREDEFVGSGDIIGISGSTGRSTGDHVHFSVKKGDQHLNPLKFLASIILITTKEELYSFLTN